jgi:probable addiction module antidote protein
MTTYNTAFLPDFDIIEQFRDVEDMAVYLQLVLDDEDPSELAHALGIIARARCMTEIAQKAG